MRVNELPIDHSLDVVFKFSKTQEYGMVDGVHRWREYREEEGIF